MSDPTKIARQLDSMVPAAPTVPEAAPSIVAPEAAGTRGWQERKGIKEEQRVERVARLAGAKARALAERRIAEGSNAFADLRSNPGEIRTIVAENDPTGETTRDYRIVVTTDNPTSAADQKLLEEEAERARRDNLDGPPVPPRRPADAPPHVVQRMTPEEIARRDAAIGPAPTIVQVKLPEAYTLPPGQVMSIARERLADQGADLRRGSIRIFNDPLTFGQIAEWTA